MTGDKSLWAAIHHWLKKDRYNINDRCR